MEHNEKKIWSFSTFRGGRGPDQGRENSLLFFFQMNPSLTDPIEGQKGHNES